MFETTVLEDKALINQGDAGDNFYVVDEGTFHIFVNGKKVLDVGPGGSFGELALMYNTPRAATVICGKGGGKVWAVDRVTFRRSITNNTFRKRKLYEGFLRTVPLLSPLSAPELSRVADALCPLQFESGDVIVEQDSAGDSFYIIVEGTAVVTKGASGANTVVGKLKKGDYFGELALLNDAPRQATVTADGPGEIKVVCLDVAAFIRLLGPCMDILKRNTAMYEMYKSEGTTERKAESTASGAEEK